MTFRALSPDQIAELRARPFTYAAVGATVSAPPDDFDFLRISHIVNHRDFRAAADQLMSWQVQRRAGLQVAASSPVVTVDCVVVMRLGVGAVALRIPCRVVYVVDEPDAHGFAYGTLPGHPESGEESFVLRKRNDGRVEFTITAFSKPASRAARLGGPISRRLQRVMTNRYLTSLDT